MSSILILWSWGNNHWNFRFGLRTFFGLTDILRQLYGHFTAIIRTFYGNYTAIFGLWLTDIFRTSAILRQLYGNFTAIFLGRFHMDSISIPYRIDLILIESEFIVNRLLHKEFRENMHICQTCRWISLKELPKISWQSQGFQIHIRSALFL